MTTLTKEVTLNPGESQAVSFQVTPQVAGVYSVNVDGLTGNFMATIPVGTLYGYAIPNALIQVYDKVATFTDGNGYYEIANLPTGPYTIACYGESHWPAITRASIIAGQATEVNFDLVPQSPGRPMLSPRRIIYCGISPHIPTVLRGGQWEVLSDEGYADNIYEWLRDPSVEYAFLIAKHGSPSILYLKARETSPYYKSYPIGYEGIHLSAGSIIEALANRQPFKLVLLSGCDSLDIGGSSLSFAFGGSALGQSKPFVRAGGIRFFEGLNQGKSAYQAYIASGPYVTDPIGTIGLLVYWGDTTPEFRLG